MEAVSITKKIQYLDYQKDIIRGTHIDIYGDDYETAIHPGKLFMHLYGEICYTYIIYAEIIVETFLKKLIEKFNIDDSNFLLKHEQAKNSSIQRKDFNYCQYLVRLKEKLLLDVTHSRLEFLYAPSIDFKDINEIIPLIKKSKKRAKHNRKFYMVAASNHTEFGFYLQEFDVKKIKVNLTDNYNEDFIPTHNKIFTFLNKKNTNGLVLLHGKYGTGKTTYLRHTIANINKRFIFLPLDLMDAISSPNFLPFISEYKDSVLILEDCEDLLMPRDSSNKTNNSLVNLLNLGDGLLADALDIKIICTFNAELKRIDKAILRKGRLIARYEFKELELLKAKALSQKMGLFSPVAQPATLAELYNMNSENYGNTTKERKVGF